MHPRPRPGEVGLGLAPVDLRRAPRRVELRDEHLARPMPELAAPAANVVTDRRLGHNDAVLVDEPAPDALGRVTLLARRLEVGEQPLVDQLPIGAELRRRARGRRVGRSRRSS